MSSFSDSYPSSRTYSKPTPGAEGESLLALFDQVGFDTDLYHAAWSSASRPQIVYLRLLPITAAQRLPSVATAANADILVAFQAKPVQVTTLAYRSMTGKPALQHFTQQIKRAKEHLGSERFTKGNLSRFLLLSHEAWREEETVRELGTPPRRILPKNPKPANDPPPRQVGKPDLPPGQQTSYSLEEIADLAASPAHLDNILAGIYTHQTTEAIYNMADFPFDWVEAAFYDDTAESDD